MRSTFYGVVLVLAMGACNSDHRPPAQTEQHAEALGAKNMTGARPRGMRNCPSSVPSATTSATATADGVDLRITSTDPRAQQRIATLAAAHVGPTLHNPFILPHTGLGGGPGTLGFCPIIHANTLVRYEALPDGVLVHVTTTADRVRELQDATTARVHAIALAHRPNT
jgi:hypothetical protein